MLWKQNDCHIKYRVSTTTGRRRLIGCLIFIGHFQQKSPVIGGSFAKRDLQRRASDASAPPCSEGYELCILSWQQNYTSLLQKSPIKERFYSAKKTYTLLCIETQTVAYMCQIRCICTRVPSKSADVFLVLYVPARIGGLEQADNIISLLYRVYPLLTTKL